MLSRHLLFSFLLCSFALQAQSPDEPALRKRATDLVSRMTLEEKISQMQNHSVAIPRLGIPEYDWWNEGLHGIARSGYATVFPQAIGLAATWDTDLLHQVANTISTEARAKYNEAIRRGIHSIYYGLTIWSPNINIFRDPRWGRGQETYGEDPYLTSRLAVAFIRGLQGDDPRYLKTVATPKHFAVHSGPESDRHKFNVSPSPFDLEDTYLFAFRAAITEARADSLMCAYNEVNHVPACASRELLENKLRKDWQFNGFVTSDCGAVSDFFSKDGHHFSADAPHAAAAALLAGTDTSCGTEYAALTDAVKQGLVREEVIDTAVERLMLARLRLGLFERKAQVSYAHIPFSEDNSTAHRNLALEASRKAMVLLKNDNGILPLSEKVKTIAVIGPNAASLAALEGNYNGVSSQPVLPIDGIEREFRGRAKVLYAQGSPYADGVSLPVPRTALHPVHGSENGLKAQYFNNAELRGKPKLTRTDRQIDFDWNSASPAPGIPAENFGVRWSGMITPPKIGDYSFDLSFAHCFPCFSRESYVVFVDGKQAAAFSTDESENGHQATSPPFQIHFSDTRPHPIRIDYSHHSKLFGAGLSFNWQTPAGALLPEATAIAKEADAVIAFVGLSPELEGEEMPVHVEGFAGGDRTSIDLPAAQNNLLSTIEAAGKPIIVVLLNGSAVAVNFAKQHADAILESWYPGESGGDAIAETLSGKNNPGGRLPVTFYASTEQLPPFTDYSMHNRTYRFFNGQPLFGFGYGLSYTQFAYANVQVLPKELDSANAVTLEVDVRNSGTRKGDEVVELYLTTPPFPDAPLRALRAFARVSLGPGESRHVSFALSPRQLSSVAEDGSRNVLAGEYTFTIGSTQPGPGFNGLQGSFSIAKGSTLAAEHIER